MLKNLKTLQEGFDNEYKLIELFAELQLEVRRL